MLITDRYQLLTASCDHHWMSTTDG